MRFSTSSFRSLFQKSVPSNHNRGKINAAHNLTDNPALTEPGVLSGASQSAVEQRDLEKERDYQERMDRERAAYKHVEDVHALPDIFHYWSNKYLKPKLEEHGISGPEDFFYQYVNQYCESHPQQQVIVVSLGSGNCDMEISCARRLLEAGLSNFRFSCLEINTDMLDRGIETAQQHDLGHHFQFDRCDLNEWTPNEPTDIYIANQSLHHIVALEQLFDGVRDSLQDSGWFLISDMIGRNGHQRWPEAMEMLEPLWQQIPHSHRKNHILKRQEEAFLNHDCSTEAFEGIRAQDILPLLIQRMHFELFVPFANLISVFIDRPFGHNFDEHNEWATHFIDRVHEIDEEAFVRGRLKPTQMIAATSKTPRPLRLVHDKLTPRYCVRWPD